MPNFLRLFFAAMSLESNAAALATADDFDQALLLVLVLLETFAALRPVKRGPIWHLAEA